MSCKDLHVSATLGEPLFNVAETAMFLKVSRRTVYDLIASGELPAFRVGGQLRLDQTAVAAWLAAHHTQNPTGGRGGGGP